MTSIARRRPIAIAICLAALTGTAVLAGPQGHHGDAQQRVDDRLAHMTRELSLTPEQQTRIRALIDEQHAAIDRLRQETQKGIDALLTEAQRAERDRLMAERLDRRVDRLADRLDLSGDQTAQIRAIFQAREDDPALTRSEIRERIVAVLTDGQRKELESMDERRRDRRPGAGPDRGPERGPGPDGEPGPAP
jgi:periplasmic protein CpxP/Spy